MRTGFPGGPRLEWYDRNPQTTSLYYAGSLAPHSVTTRATYTVPTGKKAILESAFIDVERATVATTVGRCLGSLGYTPYGGSLGIFLMVVFTDNTLGYDKFLNQGESGVLRTGDIILFQTYDASTGGTVNYTLQNKITEFDA